jgi:hypothetical protein
MRWTGYLARIGEKKNEHGVLMEKPEGKGLIGRSEHRWEDNMRMDLTEMGWGGMDLINLAKDRDKCRALVNTVMNFRVP